MKNHIEEQREAKKERNVTEGTKGQDEEKVKRD